MISRAACQALVMSLAMGVFGAAYGQDDAADENPALVDFLQDVRPILTAKCLQCHGPEDAKNDFRVDDSESMLGYLEPGDLENSFLWTDYIVTDDPDMQMPPPDADVERLTGTELATLKVWIEEGARWAEPPLETGEGAEESAEQSEVDVANRSLVSRVWSFSGLFHPASVHFPVALLTVSTLFVLLSFFSRTNCEPVAFHCLWIGAVSAVGACMCGWAYAPHEGYGAGFSFDFATSAIDRHRWLGVAVAVLSLLLIPMARSVRRTGDVGMRIMWLVGSMFMLAGVSTAGYQGGELTYGEGHYQEEFERLFPEMVGEAAEEADAEPASDESAADGPQASDESSAVEMDASEGNEDASADPPSPTAVSQDSAADATTDRQ